MSDAKPVTEEELAGLIAGARSNYEALPLEQQKAMDKEQAIGFVYGNLKLFDHNVTKEMVAKAVDDFWIK